MKNIYLIFCFTLCIASSLQDQRQVQINNVIINFLDSGVFTDYFVISKLQPNIDPNDAWIAVGLNSRRRMDGAVAVVCRNDNGVGTVSHHYLNGFQPQLLYPDNPSQGLFNFMVQVNEGYLVCRFRRENKYNEFVSNIDTGYAHILIAYGSGSLSYHGSNRNSTVNKILVTKPFTQPPYTQPSTQRPTPQQTASPFPTQPSSQRPTLTQTASPFPTQPSTQRPTPPQTASPFPTRTTNSPNLDQNNFVSPLGYILNWINNSDGTTDFIYEARVTSNNAWAGFGLSTDNGMGGDDVAVCKFYCIGDNCQSSIEHYWNNGRNPELIDQSNPSVGFSNMRVNYRDGKLSCSFTRKNSMPGVNNYVDSTAMPYFLLNADGFVDQNGRINYHSKREASPSPISFIGSTFTTTGTIATGISTRPPPPPVKPIHQVIQEVVQIVTGFFNFLQTLRNP